MTELHAVEVVEGELRRPSEVCLQDHERNRLAGGDITAHQLREEGRRDELVSNGANNTQREDERQAKEHRDDEGPDGEPGGEDLDGDAAGDEAENKQGAIPPERYFWVGHHEAGMNIAVISE